jgi:hypothetical protein
LNEPLLIKARLNFGADLDEDSNFCLKFSVENHSGGRDCKNRPPEIKFPDETTCCPSRRLFVDVRQSRNPERRRFLPFRL